MHGQTPPTFHHSNSRFRKNFSAKLRKNLLCFRVRRQFFCSTDCFLNVFRLCSCLAACAEEFGIKIKDASVSKDSAGHETLSLSFEKPQENFNVSLLTKKLCSDTGYELSFPTLIQNDDIYTLIFKQKEKLGFKIAAAVKPGPPLKETRPWISSSSHS